MADELTSIVSPAEVKVYCETITLVQPDLLFTTIEEVKQSVIYIAKEFNYELSFNN